MNPRRNSVLNSFHRTCRAQGIPKILSLLLHSIQDDAEMYLLMASAFLKPMHGNRIKDVQEY
jgi:hypothetical protein